MALIPKQHIVLLLSDLHCGKKTKRYNSKVFNRSVERVTQSTIDSYNSIIEAFDVEELTVVLNGDIIDGETIYTGQAFGLEFDIDQQRNVAGKAFGQMLDRLSDYFSKVNVRCVYGNHGIANYRGSNVANWDISFYRELQARYANDPVVNVRYTRNYYDIVRIEGHPILVTHGDAIKPSGDTPFTAITKRVTKWAIGGIPQRFEMVLLGHLHNPYHIYAGDIPILGNGTFISDDEYASKLGFPSLTNQWIFGVSRERLLTYLHPIDLRIRG